MHAIELHCDYVFNETILKHSSKPDLNELLSATTYMKYEIMVNYKYF